jgi:hypothetical protein
MTGVWKPAIAAEIQSLLRICEAAGNDTVFAVLGGLLLEAFAGSATTIREIE